MEDPITKITNVLDLCNKWICMVCPDEMLRAMTTKDDAKKMEVKFQNVFVECKEERAEDLQKIKEGIAEIIKHDIQDVNLHIIHSLTLDVWKTLNHVDTLRKDFKDFENMYVPLVVLHQHLSQQVYFLYMGKSEEIQPAERTPHYENVPLYIEIKKFIPAKDAGYIYENRQYENAVMQYLRNNYKDLDAYLRNKVKKFHKLLNDEHIINTEYDNFIKTISN